SPADENDRICLETYASIPISQTHN
ncbi:ATP-binding protein, partial [Mesorhizobium sp. M8A.F.Ca.ET.197.01.1.1]